MSMSVQVEVTGGKELQAKLKQLGVDLNDYSNVMKVIGKDLVKYFSGPAFLSQGGVFGARWAKLSPAYQAYKMKHYRAFTNTILVRSDGSHAMRNDFTAVSNKTGVVIGNSADYFKYHQSAAPRSKIPRRQMMGVNDPVRQMIIADLKKDVAEKLAKV